MLLRALLALLLARPAGVGGQIIGTFSAAPAVVVKKHDGADFSSGSPTTLESTTASATAREGAAFIC